MTLEQIYYIGQTIAVVAIIGSLVAIFFQMRLQNAIRQTEIARSMTGAFQSTWARMHEDPAFTRLVRVAASHWDKLPDNQKFVVHSYWAEIALVASDQLFQSGGKLKPGSAGYKMVVWFVGMVRTPGPQLWWSKAKFFFDPAFQQIVDRFLVENVQGTESWMNFPLWQVSEEDVRLVLGEGQPPVAAKVGTQP